MPGRYTALCTCWISAFVNQSFSSGPVKFNLDHSTIKVSPSHSYIVGGFTLYVLVIHLLVHKSSWLCIFEILTYQNIYPHFSSFNYFELNSTYLLWLFVLEILCFPPRSAPYLFCSALPLDADLYRPHTSWDALVLNVNSN